MLPGSTLHDRCLDSACARQLLRSIYLRGIGTEHCEPVQAELSERRRKLLEVLSSRGDRMQATNAYPSFPFSWDTYVRLRNPTLEGKNGPCPRKPGSEREARIAFARLTVVLEFCHDIDYPCSREFSKLRHDPISHFLRF